ncbi:MAG: threonylcarbamoyl-AMP synthase [Dysgonamonadaceae bacterium]|jgi:L-threonylcarbamoyladenylate synthase|nr:threonylcarbamoyl-AMP synthase [Dysgonamonadaceae bacterium]
MNEINTKLVSVKDIKVDIDNIQLVADTLRTGGLAAMPTETVYGIAANALDEKAVSRIFSVKGRPQDNPLIVHIADVKELSVLVQEVTPNARKLTEVFWPGALTMVLPSSGLIPKSVNAGLNTIAVRMPGLPVTREIIRRAGVPIAAPSANISGRPSPTTAQHCIDDLWGKVELIADGGECAVGLESTVISLATATPRILRPGTVTPEQIAEVLGCEIEIDESVFNHNNDGVKVSSPGMKYKHYSPKASVTILDGNTEQVMRYLSEQDCDDIWALVFEEDLPFLPISGLSLGKFNDVHEQAFRLFAAFRELDKKGAKHIYARMPNTEGIGLAVYNRMIRAAGFRVINI